MITDFKLVARHYSDLSHQNEALDWLWAQTGSFVKAEFTKRWRSTPAPAAVAATPVVNSSTTNQAGVELIKHFEGFRSNAYICPAGVWTVGYGTTRIAGRPVNANDRVSQEEGETLLRQDLVFFEREVNRLVRVSLTSNQFSALVSFTYNVGGGALASSTLLRLLNAGDYAAAADQFARWNRGGGSVLAGLVRRRAEERALFLKP